MCYHFVFTHKLTMYRLLALVVTALAAVYIAGAAYFFRQERWAREPSSVSTTAFDEVRHPDALLGLVDERFARQRFGDIELSLVHEALQQAPSFYQSPFFLATFYSSRLENPAAVRASFEATVARYPANGRLHVAYGIWLLESRTSLGGWHDPGDPASLKDPMQVAQAHLKRGMALERDLSWRALQALQLYRVAPERWFELTPDDALSRRHLMDALFLGGHYEAGLRLVRDAVDSSEDGDTLHRAAVRALEAEDPALALDAATKWKTTLETSRRGGGDYVDAALLMSRAYDALNEPELSNQVLEDVLVSIDGRFGSSSRAMLEALCTLAVEHVSRGQTFAAESFYAEAVARSPSYTPALIGLARALFRSGDYDGAITRYEDVLRIEPDHPQARKELKFTLVKVAQR
jgi:tetratricopeptide (TPR) repeat protein